MQEEDEPTGARGYAHEYWVVLFNTLPKFWLNTYRGGLLSLQWFIQHTFIIQFLVLPL
jgi:hypothetical protein